MLTETFTFIIAWYNLPFTIMLGLCVLAAVLQLIGLDTDSEPIVEKAQKALKHLPIIRDLPFDEFYLRAIAK